MNLKILKLFIPIAIFIYSPMLWSSPGDSTDKETIDKPLKATFGKKIKKCYERPGKGQRCYEYRYCTNTYFRKLEKSQIYYLKEGSNAQHLRKDGDKEQNKYCNGEPTQQKITIYNESKDDKLKLIEMGTISDNGCSLTIMQAFDYKDSMFLRARCTQSGTGNLFRESFYFAKSNNFSPVILDIPSLKLPHETLSHDQVEFKNGEFIFSSSAHPRHCGCVAGFSAKLELKKDREGNLRFNYVQDSYKPAFTSKSNEKNRTGLKHYKERNYKKAVEEFVKATILDVTNYEAYSNLGIAYIKIGNYRKSIEATTYAYNNAKKKIKANSAYNLGKAYEKLNNFQQAIIFYTESNKLSPSDNKIRKINLLNR